MILSRLSSSGRLTAALGFSCGVAVGAIALAVGAVGAAVDATSPRSGTARRAAHAAVARRAGRPMELRYDVVCQADRSESRARFRQRVRPPRRRGRVPEDRPCACGRDWERPWTFRRRASPTTPSSTTAPATMTVPAAGVRLSVRGPQSPLRRSASDAHAAARNADGRAVAATWGMGAALWAAHRARARAHRALGVRRRPQRERRRARPGQRPARALSGRTGRAQLHGHRLRRRRGDLAVGADGTAYVLDQGAEPVARLRAFRSARRDDRRHGTARTCCGAGPRARSSTGTRRHVEADSRRRRGSPQARAAGRRRPAGPSGRRWRRGGRARWSRRGALRARTRRQRPSGLAGVEPVDLGEIQLAEPFGDGMLVVLRVWTETKAEFVALVLSPNGLPARSPSMPHSGPSRPRSAGSARRARRSTSCARPRRSRDRDLRPGRCK